MALEDQHLKDAAFTPSPGPQAEALASEADILLFGGAAGCGTTSLAIGCAALNHRNGIIFRRERVLARDTLDTSEGIMGKIQGASLNLDEGKWSWGGGRTLRVSSMPLSSDWKNWSGIMYDYIAFDEVSDFEREQVFSLLPWLRPSQNGQRSRVILSGKPPISNEYHWIRDEFDPWISACHTSRAKPGELRWSITVGGETIWVDGPGEYMANGEPHTAVSRTFIPAGLPDNPYMALDPSYNARLASLPDPLMSKLRSGDFSSQP